MDEDYIDQLIADLNRAGAQLVNASCNTETAAARMRAQARRDLIDIQDRIGALVAEIPDN